MNLRKLFFSLTCCMILSAFSAQANASIEALTVGDVFYVGFIDDGVPASPADEASYINTLITLAAGATNTTIGTETYNRVGSSNPGPFPTSVVLGSFKDELNSGGNSFSPNLSGTWNYILAKYGSGNLGGGALVWYSAAGFSAGTTVPSTLGGRGVSHISGYNYRPDVIPEPTSLLVWGGLATLAFGFGPRRRA